MGSGDDVFSGVMDSVNFVVDWIKDKIGFDICSVGKWLGEKVEGLRDFFLGEMLCFEK